MVWHPKRFFGSSHVPRFSLVFPVLIAFVAAQAQSPVEITVHGQTGYPVALIPLSGPLGPSASSTLSADLQNAGPFRLTRAPQGAFVVSGSANGGQLEGRLNAPNGSVIFSRTYRSGDANRDLRQFADDVVLSITGKPGIASSRIVFVSNKSGHKELYVCNYDGGNIHQLTHDASISVSPSFSADGTRIAYTSYRSGYPDIFLINLGSGARSRIIKSPGTNSGAAFSPDGNRLALSMSFSGNPELYLTNTSGGGAKRLTRSRAVEASPAWFPDNRRLVYVSNQNGGPQLYEMSSGGGTGRPIAVGFGYCTAPSVSPDGARLAFSARSGGGMAIAVHDFSSGKTTALTSGGNAEDPCWGADSRHLVYTQEGELFLRDVDAGTAKRIVSGMGKISEPSWSR